MTQAETGGGQDEPERQEQSLSKSQEGASPAESAELGEPPRRLQAPAVPV